MSRAAFLVQRRALQDDGELRCRADRPSGFVPHVPLRLFGDRSAAEAYRDDLLARLRLGLNPFELQRQLSELTSLKPAAFYVCLWGLNVAPPVMDDVIDWPRWWRETAPDLTREQIEAVWQLLDRLRLVEVVELPLDR
jgi:hypothetical protein